MSLARFLWYFCLTSLLAINPAILSEDVSILGQIGTSQESRVSGPDDDGSFFYLNTLQSAEANGTVSSIRYCYAKPQATHQLYQATVGFYRRYRDSDIFQLVSDFSFNLTIVENSITAENSTVISSNDFRCDYRSFPPVAIQEGDVIGACTRDFPDLSIGRLVLTGRVSFLFFNLNVMRSAQVQSLCPGAGNLPLLVSTLSLDSNRQQLLISANITNETFIPTTDNSALMNALDDNSDQERAFTIAIGASAGAVFLLILVIAFLLALLIRQAKRTTSAMEDRAFIHVNNAYGVVREEDAGDEVRMAENLACGFENRVAIEARDTNMHYDYVPFTQK